MHPPIKLLLSRSARSPAKITSGFCHWVVSARKPRHLYQPMSLQPQQVNKNFFCSFNPGALIFTFADMDALPGFPRIAFRLGIWYQSRSKYSPVLILSGTTSGSQISTISADRFTVSTSATVLLPVRCPYTSPGFTISRDPSLLISGRWV